jgi:hypothetical protein
MVGLAIDRDISLLFPSLEGVGVGFKAKDYNIN